MNIYKGKLTYTIALVTIVWAVVGYFLGYVEPVQAGEYVLVGLATFGVRRAIA